MMWLPNITVLSQFFRCYAVDIIGDFGRSELDSVRHYPKNAKQYSFWLTEILQSLKIEAVSLMGISHGCYIAANHAALMPHTINKLVLISPSAVVLTLNRVLPRIIHYLLIPSENNRRQLTEWLLGQSAATRAEYYEQIYRGLEGRPKVPIPLIIP
jgi:pimeloyl-ACP methyl ester carboxylesterase